MGVSLRPYHTSLRNRAGQTSCTTCPYSPEMPCVSVTDTQSLIEDWAREVAHQRSRRRTRLAENPNSQNRGTAQMLPPLKPLKPLTNVQGTKRKQKMDDSYNPDEDENIKGKEIGKIKRPRGRPPKNPVTGPLSPTKAGDPTKRAGSNDIRTVPVMSASVPSLPPSTSASSRPPSSRQNSSSRKGARWIGQGIPLKKIKLSDLECFTPPVRQTNIASAQSHYDIPAPALELYRRLRTPVAAIPLELKVPKIPSFPEYGHQS